MKISSKRTYFATMESVAMTDIVMNMFIFFFISFSLLYTFNPEKIKKIDVNLPSAENTKPADNKDKIDIAITKEDKIFLDGKQVTVKELESGVRGIHKKNPQMPVLLNIDKKVSFDKVVNILDLLNGLDISALSIAATDRK